MRRGGLDKRLAGELLLNAERTPDLRQLRGDGPIGCAELGAASRDLLDERHGPTASPMDGSDGDPGVKSLQYLGSVYDVREIASRTNTFTNVPERGLFVNTAPKSAVSFERTNERTRTNTACSRTYIVGG